MSVSLMYGISFAVACIIFGIIVFIQQQKVENIFTFLFLIMIFVHFGYFALSISTTYEEALLAYKLTFLDGTLVPYLMLQCIMEICGLHRNKTVTRLVALPIVTYILGLTAGYSNLYYSNIEFRRINGYTYLERSHGPLHFLGTVCVIVFTLAPIMPVIYSIKHRNTVSYKYTIFCGLIIFANVVGYVIQSVLGIEMEILPFQFNLVEICLVYIVYKINRHDVRRQGDMLKNRMREYGFLAFDNEGRYLGSDDVAKSYFPEILKLKIDTKVDSFFIKEAFLNWENVLIDDESTFKYFQRDGKDLKCRRKPLIEDKLGTQNGFIIEIIDDTENVRHVKELNRINEELREANESKGIFLSRMSHEIRTPINAIIGMDEMIMRETEDKKIKPYAKTIASSAQMLLMLVNDLLDFSKLEAGKMELFEEEYELEKMIHDAVLMVRQRAINKDLELIIESEGKLPKTLYGDRLKTQQVIMNLLTNAIKYTDTGSVTLKISTGIVFKNANDGSDNTDYVEMRYDVIDTGIGIKKEDIKSLFTAFNRVDMERNNSIEGTGLGLAIISSYVKMMDGRVSVDSEFGKGSIFTARIPQKKVSEECISNITSESLKFDVDDKNSKKRLYAPAARILVVDDNPTNLVVFKFLLGTTGVQITEANSGAKAIDILEKEQFDLIFLDHMMPELDGIQTLQIIKERNLLGEAKTPVIALTANAISSARYFYLQNGFSDYVSKPIDVSRLIEVIAENLHEDKYSFVETEEKDTLKSDESIKDEVVKLPELDEFDFVYAIRNLGSADAVKLIAGEIFRNMPATKENLNRYFADIEQVGACKLYQLEIHTIKGNSASIGALLLSKLCRLIEIACKEGNLEKIKALHPYLIEEIDKHSTRLQELVDVVPVVAEVDLKDITSEELASILENLKECLIEWDYDSAEKIVGDLRGYRIPEAMRDKIAEITDEIQQFNGAYAIDLIDELK